VFFSADTGYTFREVLNSRLGRFMSDRKAGDFHLIGIPPPVETQVPWGFYYRIYITYYTDYGKTFVGTYCHELQKHYKEVACRGITDLQATIEDKNNVFLCWDIPETDNPVTGFSLYRNDILLKELQEATCLDENLPDGNYTYYVKAAYADGCESLSYNIVTLTITNTGIVETHKEIDGILVFPNPTTGELHVVAAGHAPLSVMIFDIFGRNLTPIPSPNWRGVSEGRGEVNISHLPTGMYFVRVMTENGIITRKIVKQ
jgi:hypothetical protein